MVDANASLVHVRTLNSLRVIDAASGTVVGLVPIGPGLTDMTIDPASGTLYVTSTDGEGVGRVAVLAR